ncbi:YitT family protein [Sinanaerobacter chloroacetimidivorans]|uniref:YitT family protein n=1 Tax=Sinanaerobacter chloroacetimidivorans TaxID=2818044 RepID=A0A8J7W5Y2_9FIRM|nr:YitT family protein [Sinanaerobacter chloroacetimidivorans]MBR0599688.1 YitT family protein [Sinanaerobacter chloroacetimidivorans]
MKIKKKIRKKKEKSKMEEIRFNDINMKELKEYAAFAGKLILGCLLISIAINGLYIPSKLLGGGLNGISMLLNIVFGWNLSMVYFILNIPIFIIGMILLSRRFMIFTILGLLFFTFSLSITSGVVIPTQSPLTTILLGGCIYGAGNGFVYSVGASTGGTDIIGKIINRRFSFSIASVGFFMNLIIIGISVYYFGVDLAVSTLAAMFVASRMTNFVVDGMNHKRMVLIVSEEKSRELAAAILKEMGRGVTVLQGTGAYTGHNKDIIYCVIGMTQVTKLKSIVKKIDRKAFVTITETAQVYGKGRGFYQMDQEV